MTRERAARLEQLIEILAEKGSELTDPLIAAASVNNVRAITALIDLKADINGNGDWSPLEEALYWVHPASVEVLLNRCAVKIKCHFHVVFA